MFQSSFKTLSLPVPLPANEWFTLKITKFLLKTLKKKKELENKWIFFF